MNSKYNSVEFISFSRLATLLEVNLKEKKDVVIKAIKIKTMIIHRIVICKYLINDRLLELFILFPLSLQKHMMYYYKID